MQERPKQEDWYNNKELFEMIQELKVQLIRTTHAVQEYNDLRETQNSILHKLEGLEETETKSEGRGDLWELAREWGGWIIALVSLYLLYMLDRG